MKELESHKQLCSFGGGGGGGGGSKQKNVPTRREVEIEKEAATTSGWYEIFLIKYFGPTRTYPSLKITCMSYPTSC